MKESGANDSVCRRDVVFADMDEYYHIDMELLVRVVRCVWKLHMWLMQ